MSFDLNKKKINLKSDIFLKFKLYLNYKYDKIRYNL